MKFHHRHVIGAAMVVALQFASAGAYAQLLDSVKGQLGGAQGGSAGSAAQGLGDGLSLSSLSAGSAGNAAGVLEFCIKNNYLEGNDAQGVKDQLMGKISGGSGQAESDPGYSKGAQGILTGSDGKSVDLSGGGLKEEITRKACDQVLEQGKSFL
ncbi:DUF2501 domain-containing protein [Bordetella petrii]|uniref:DUF2501 domain-containing protein n=1 Tax=Bordetella petrii TaxID=94624 RepID=UPI001E58CD49|nr:DUF2501 domain-containing protein [Bordetella petrii]MCD0503433.1 DUF2501 domain-containing protein [Bordetella petrii]